MPHESELAVIDDGPHIPPPPTLGDWLKGGALEGTRKVEFQYASYTHGAIQCILTEITPKKIRSATGAGSHEGDAYAKAMLFLRDKPWTARGL